MKSIYDILSDWKHVELISDDDYEEAVQSLEADEPLTQPEPLSFETLQSMNDHLVYVRIPNDFGADLIIPSLVACNADNDDDPDEVYLTNNLGGRSTYNEVAEVGGTVYARQQMNDRFLFRGKRMDNGGWVEGAFSPKDSYETSMIFPEKGAHSCIIPLSGKDEGYWIRVDPQTLGQCTGLRDRNGKLIFEGDIVKGFMGCGGYIFAIRWNASETRFEAVSAHFACAKTLRNDFNLSGLEIIGSVHDNPELLGAGHEPREG